MRKRLRVGCIQSEILPENEDNLENLHAYFEDIAQSHPEIICLPERWWFYDIESLTKEQLIQSFDKQYQFVQNMAKKYKIPIISGGIWRFDNDEDKFYISSYYFNAKGEEIAKQDKIHLYGKEKEFFSPGNSLNIIYDSQIDLRFAMLICFDLNISFYLPRQAVKHGAEIIFSPVMIRADGIENWKIYVQARALENRVPIITCNPIAQIPNRTFNGQSIIIQFNPGNESPSSLDVYSLSRKPQIAVREINLEFPNKIRAHRLNENISPTDITISQIIN